MRTLRAASLRHLLRHPAQLTLALMGLALGVGTIVAVDVATASARRAFARAQMSPRTGTSRRLEPRYLINR